MASPNDTSAHPDTAASHLFPGMGKYADKSECPDRAARHMASEPTGYRAWHEWADGMRKTHVQSQCPTCGYWTIWTREESVRGV